MAYQAILCHTQEEDSRQWAEKVAEHHPSRNRVGSGNRDGRTGHWCAARAGHWLCLSWGPGGPAPALPSSPQMSPMPSATEPLHVTVPQASAIAHQALWPLLSPNIVSPTPPALPSEGSVSTRVNYTCFFISSFLAWLSF